MCTTRAFSICAYNAGYAEFGKHLNKTGRPIVYSCSWPAYQEDKSMPVSIYLYFFTVVRMYFFCQIYIGMFITQWPVTDNYSVK